MQLFIRRVKTVDGEAYELVESLYDTEVIATYGIDEYDEALADARFFSTGEVERGNELQTC